MLGSCAPVFAGLLIVQSSAIQIGSKRSGVHAHASPDGLECVSTCDMPDDPGQSTALLCWGRRVARDKQASLPGGARAALEVCLHPADAQSWE